MLIDFDSPRNAKGTKLSPYSVSAQQFENPFGSLLQEFQSVVIKPEKHHAVRLSNDHKICAGISVSRSEDRKLLRSLNSLLFPPRYARGYGSKWRSPFARSSHVVRLLQLRS
ncbi:hypothetical protein ACVILJ_004302 [Bradyrhizobium diazoefficiens]